ncbi:MAG TPA: DUF4236 domain-containing protein [Rhizomicrobium sp.]|jgi:hypothetical protein|nr:DUF4236 domain-containing protein [Rhizomicrobium sp.]
MGWRFQKVLRVIPGVRINLSKSGISGSVGPRGASVNVGRHGVTTSAGLPGTGLSYRQRIGHRGTWLGIGLLIAALAFSAWHNGGVNALAPRAVSIPDAAAQRVIADASPAMGIRYVHRDNAVVRAEPSEHAAELKHEAKGDQITLIATSAGWAKVQDGETTGWMRIGTLGEAPPE